jgi:hypothetical protein
MPRLAAVALALTCAATLIACGGSSSSSSGSAGATAGGAAAGGGNAAGFAKFRDCLKAQGVDVPPGRPGGGGGNGYGPPAGGAPQQQTPAQQKAMQACAKYRPQGGLRGGGGGGGQQNIAAFKPYLQCLKAQGLAIDINAGFGALRGLKRDDPKLQPALKACASKLPQRPQGAPPAPASSSAGTATQP